MIKGISVVDSMFEGEDFCLNVFEGLMYLETGDFTCDTVV